MRQLLHVSLITTILIGVLAVAPAKPALAACDDGTAASEAIVCDTDPADGNVLGGGGNDTITVTDDVTNTPDVSGDGLSGTTLVGGSDTITTNAATNVVAGDDLNATTLDADFVHAVEGGNDTITTNSAVLEDLSGDRLVLSGSHSPGVAGDLVGTNFAVGGSDTIIVNGAVIGDVMGDEVIGGGIAVAADGSANVTNAIVGGNDNIFTSGAVAGDVAGDELVLTAIATGINDFSVASDSVVGGADSIFVNGSAFNVTGDYILPTANASATDSSATASIAAVGGSDTIVVNGPVTSNVSGDVIAATAIATATGATGTIYALGSLATVGGSDLITTNGTVGGDVRGDNISAVSISDAVIDNGTASSTSLVSVVGGSDTIVINGADTVLGDVIGDAIVATAVATATATAGTASATSIAFVTGGNDTITINGAVNGDVLGDGLIASATTSIVTGGNDKVIIGAGGVSYSTTCSDIPVTQVTASQGTVAGLIDGEGGSDALVFNVLTPNAGDSALQSQLDALDPAGGSTEVGGATYNWANFESLSVALVVFTEGPTRYFDDGVTLAFASTQTGRGLDICNGPAGLRAGTIDFNLLAQGQTEFGANGFTVRLFAVGGGQYEVHVYNAFGVEQFNDADKDGAADSLFKFTP